MNTLRKYNLRKATVFFIFSLCTALCSCALQPTQKAIDALESDEKIEVEINSRFIGFRPKNMGEAIRIGFIFYPGGLVNERAYAPLCRKVAEAGFYVAITPVPLNLAVFDPFVANAPIRENRFVRSWAVGGHSLGGAMAARFVHTDSNACKGLVLLAAYPDVSNDLSGRNLSVLSVSASLDGLATPATIEANKKYLPPPPLTRYVVLEGGNHAQFGNYGRQNRDNDATMSYQEQQERTASEIIAFLSKLR